MITLSIILLIVCTSLLVGLFIEMNVLISNLSIIINEGRETSRLNNEILNNDTAIINEILEVSKQNNEALINK